LNDLLGRLQRSFERERRFSADLAHELRTPVAELRSLAECALKWPESRDAATDREVLAVAHQMERLVAHLLALTRAEEGRSEVVIEDVDVATFVPEVWQRFAAHAAERELAVTLEVAALTSRADRVLLRSILGNLFENAVVYAPPGSGITITATASEGRVAIAVANEAPEIGPDDLPKLFDRFWRKEAARTGGEHFGLGLALSRALAEAMGWELTAALREGRIVLVAQGPQADSRNGVKPAKK
jgi:two-component system sensor histidine kinase QseC